jgi:uncharacterized protein
MACLSSRVPYGEVVSPEKLDMIERAENVLRDLGFYDVRVRHHELRVSSDAWRGNLAPKSKVQRLTSNVQRPNAGPSSGIAAQPATANRQPATILHLARIEVGPVEMRKFLEDGISLKVAEALKRIGYTHVTLDLQGYRRGSSNEIIKAV